jgi:hypothetical protein
VLAWPGVEEQPLVARGVPVVRALDRIGAEGRAAIEAAPRTWARLWSRLPLVDGRSFRELLTLNDTSLLWLTEDFVHRETTGPRCAETAETALRILESTRVDEVDAAALPAPIALLLARACTARGVLFHGAVPRPRPLSPRPRPRSPGWRRLRGLLAPAAVPPDLSPSTGFSAATLLCLVGPGAVPAGLGEIADDAVRRELGLGVVTVGRAELHRCRTRRVWRAMARATAGLEELGRRLRGAPGLHEAYAHRGVSFADLAGGDLDAILRVRLPQAVMLLETAGALIASVRPAAVALVGFSRDDRRAVLAAADRLRIATLFIRRPESGEDDPDRTDGGPRPTAAVAWAPGMDPGPLVARLAGCVRASLEPA